MAPDSSAAAPPEAAAAPGMSEYYRRLERASLAPLWESLAALSPSEPRTRARPYRWAYADVRAHLMEAGRLITAEKAERRVVVLANPGLPGDLAVTDTLYAGLQLILPGEIAPAHRHSQSALRFVVEGEGAYTAVDGERTRMRPGDFIINHSWTWHEHGGGDGPVVWMDGLDVPLVSFLHAQFKEEHGAKAQIPSRPEGDALARYGSGLMPVDMDRGGQTSPVFSYPYERSRAALEQLKKADDPDPWRGYRLKYVNPTNGGWAMPTIGPTLSLLPRGFSTSPYKSTDGVVATVVEGRVKASIDGEDFMLGPKDVLALPGWRPYRLEALEESVLFAFSDRPVHEKLGLFREWRGPA
jgi:gentisate 1,2-dioxygenase